jgi:cold shock CspA family protein
MGDVSTSRLNFAKLSKARIAPQLRNRLLYPLEGKRFEGKIVRMEASHAFVIRDGLGDTVFLHASNVSPGLWKNLSSENRLSFSIAFTFGGANAFDIEALDFRAPIPDQLDLIWAKERESAGKDGND